MNSVLIYDWLASAEVPCKPSSPVLFIMCGLSGSGKSTISRFLAEHYGAAWIRSDIERKKLFGLKQGQSSRSLQQNIYTEKATEQTFTRMAELATGLLLESYPVILDSCALKITERSFFTQSAKSLGLHCGIIFCQANPGLLAERISHRQKHQQDPSEASEKLISKQANWLEEPTVVESDFLIRLDTAVPKWDGYLISSLENTSIPSITLRF